MPFARTQSVLKGLLPPRCFRLLYNLALCGYRVWCRLSDEVYYLCSYVYYLLKGDLRGVKRIEAIYSIRPYSMVGRVGLFATYDIATEIEKSKLSGCFVECGVARGGCSALMAMVASDRKVWLFDSFEGLPEPTKEDKYEEPITYRPKHKSACFVSTGYCLGTYEEVEELLFSKLGLSRKNVILVRGWFQETLPDYKDEIGEISFLRIDADWYESTKCCLEHLYDKVVVGGYILVDDYEPNAGCIGCQEATDEFLKNRQINAELNFDKRGGTYFVRK